MKRFKIETHGTELVAEWANELIDYGIHPDKEEMDEYASVTRIRDFCRRHFLVISTANEKSLSEQLGELVNEAYSVLKIDGSPHSSPHRYKYTDKEAPPTDKSVGPWLSGDEVIEGALAGAGLTAEEIEDLCQLSPIPGPSGLIQEVTSPQE